jgi:hypothetical protein
VAFSRSSWRTLSVILSRIPSMLSGESCCLIPLSKCVTNIFYSKTVTALDVVYALKRSGRTLYGFGA